jgi:TPR repeat protein
VQWTEHVPASYALGMMCEFGLGCEKDLNCALTCYQLACNAHYVPAMYVHSI